MKPKINPIIIKELRSRMRGARAFIILTATLLLLSGVMYGFYRITLAASSYTTVLSPYIGQTLFIALAIIELLIICFITPALTAGAISGEREKLTYEMLLTTALKPSAILWGKLISALSYVFLLLFAAIPLASLVFIFGGVSPMDMLKTLLVLVTIAIMLGVMGIFMSAWLERTARATILSYLMVLILFIGPFIVYAAVGIFRQAEPPRLILIANPISALFSATTNAGGMTQGPADILIGLSMALSGNIGMLNGNINGIPRPLFHYSLPLYGLITVIFYMLAMQMVKPVRRWRIQWQSALVVLLLLVVAGGGVALAFNRTADQYLDPSVPTPTPIFGFPEEMPVEMEAVPIEDVKLEPVKTPDIDVQNSLDQEP